MHFSERAWVTRNWLFKTCQQTGTKYYEIGPNQWKSWKWSFYRARAECCTTRPHMTTSLLWRPNGRGGVPDHQPHDCLLNRLFRRRSKKTSKLRVTGLCAGNSPGIGEFPAQMASNAEMFPFDDVIMIGILYRAQQSYCNAPCKISKRFDTSERMAWRTRFRGIWVKMKIRWISYIARHFDLMVHVMRSINWDCFCHDKGKIYAQLALHGPCWSFIMYHMVAPMKRSH